MIVGTNPRLSKHTANKSVKKKKNRQNAPSPYTHTHLPPRLAQVRLRRQVNRVLIPLSSPGQGRPYTLLDVATGVGVWVARARA